MQDQANSAFAAQLNDSLELIEQRLQSHVVADTPFVTEAANHIIAAGGKRFRPLLVVLASHLGGEPNQKDLINAALAVELTHVASLYHDDVMDDADVRRGAPSANRQWSNSIAILVGDFLFAKASTLVADLGSEFVHIQAETFSRLVQGQIAETRGALNADDPLAYYLQVVADKTGSLIAASTIFGGMVSSLEPKYLAALHRFGEEIGVVFQLSDDIIDITSDETGKTPGTDLREGVPTLPTILLHQSSDPADDELKELLKLDLDADEEKLQEALSKLRAHPVIEQAQAIVDERADRARSYLEPLPDCEAKNALAEVCNRIANRNT